MMRVRRFSIGRRGQIAECPQHRLLLRAESAGREHGGPVLQVPHDLRAKLRCRWFRLKVSVVSRESTKTVPAASLHIPHPLPDMRAQQTVAPVGAYLGARVDEDGPRRKLRLAG